MFLELIAVIFAGIAMAGVVMLTNRITGGRLPRWLAPVAAGLAMIGVTVASEYGWYGRTVKALPQGVVVAEAIESRSLYRPWTYLVPYYDRFVAVDTAGMQSHAAKPHQHLADLYFFGRWAPISQLSTVVDCTAGRRALVSAETAFADNGEISGVDWIAAPTGDAIVATICGG